MEIEKKYIISPTSSGLSLFQECKRCWWLIKNTDWERPTPPFPGLPGGVDKALKKHYDRFRTQNLLPPEINAHPKYNTLKPFDDQAKLKEFRRSRWRKDNIKQKGLAYKDETLQSILQGGLDDLLKTTDGKIVVIDYKTRAIPPTEETVEWSRLQLNVYSFLLQKLKEETEDYALLIYYWPKRIKPNGDLQFNTEIKEIKIDKDLVLSTWKEAVDTINSPSCPTTICEKGWCKDVPQP